MKKTKPEGIKIMGVENSRLMELAKTINTWQQVLSTAINEGNVNQEFVRIRMKYDSGTFSRIMSGQANLPPERIKEFNSIVGNDLTLYWLSYQSGYEVRVLPKTLEEKLKKEIEEKNKAFARINYLESILKGAISAIELPQEFINNSKNLV